MKTTNNIHISLGPGKPWSHAVLSLSLLVHANTGLLVLCGGLSLDKASPRTAALSSSLWSRISFLVPPSSLPLPAPAASSWRGPSCNWSLPRNCEHCSASVFMVFQADRNSWPVLLPDSIKAVHLDLTFSKFPIWSSSNGQIPTPLVKWGRDCSNPPMKAAGLVSTLLRSPTPPSLIGNLKTQFWKLLSCMSCTGRFTGIHCT